MTNGSNDRLDRIERILEELARNQRQIIQTQGQIVQIQERQQEQIQILVNAAKRHDALIERLDAIIERLVYREGNRLGDQPQS